MTEPGRERYALSRSNQHFRAGGRVTVHPRHGIFKPLNRKMAQRLLDASDRPIANHPFMHQVVAEAGIAAAEQAQHIIRIPAGVAHLASAKARQPRQFITRECAGRDCRLYLGRERRADAFVRIDGQNPIALRQRQGKILLLAKPQPFMRGNTRAMLARDLGRAVDAVAVNDDALVAKCHAVEALGDVRRLVLGNDDSAQARHTALGVATINFII